MNDNSSLLSYCVVDVFTNQKFKGNPLAVVFCNKDLKAVEYENIAKEFGYSETSFVHYSESEAVLRVRSFTAASYEVVGAGHNLLGAIYATKNKGIRIFKENRNDGIVMMKSKPIQIIINKYEPFNDLEIGVLQSKASVLGQVPIYLLANALGINESEIGYNHLDPVVVKTEVAHLMVPVKTRHVLTKLLPKKDLLMNLANEHKFQGVYCFVLFENCTNPLAQTRFFNPQIGITEDPATGSTAGPLAGLLLEKNIVQKEQKYKILQGLEVGRSSTIRVSAGENDILISGTAKVTMSGKIHL